MSLKKMRFISIIWGIILVSIVATLTVIGFIYKRKIVRYENLELELEEKVKQYVDKEFLYPEKDSHTKITYQELKDNEIMDSLKIAEEECDGYTIVTNNGKVYNYKTYIKCPNYKTKNYDKNNS